MESLLEVEDWSGNLLPRPLEDEGDAATAAGGEGEGEVEQQRRKRKEEEERRGMAEAMKCLKGRVHRTLAFSASIAIGSTGSKARAELLLPCWSVVRCCCRRVSRCGSLDMGQVQAHVWAHFKVYIRYWSWA